jgi:hypothetical protein
VPIIGLDPASLEVEVDLLVLVPQSWALEARHESQISVELWPRGDTSHVGIDGPGNNIMISSGNTSQGAVSSGYVLTAQDNKFSASEFGTLTSTGVHMHGVWSAAEDPFGINGCRHGGYVIVDSPWGSRRVRARLDSDRDPRAASAPRGTSRSTA